jgi:hypothetical protein
MKHDMQPLVEGCAAMKIDLHESQLLILKAILSLLTGMESKNKPYCHQGSKGNTDLSLFGFLISP